MLRGFDGNLTSGDDDLQKVAQKVDDLSVTGDVDVLVDNVSTSLSKNWKQIDLGSGKAYDDYDILGVTLREPSGRTDVATAWFSTRRLTALAANAITGETWYATARKPYIQPTTDDIAGGKVIIGKRSNSRYVALAVDIDSVTYDLTIEGYKAGVGGGGGAGDITGVTAGDGLTGGGQSGAVSLAVNPGDGMEIAGDAVRVKLDGSTLARSSSGVKIADDGVDSDQVADGAIDLAHLSAGGTKDSTTFLRGDNEFAAPAGGGGGPDYDDVQTFTLSGSANNTWYDIGTTTDFSNWGTTGWLHIALYKDSGNTCCIEWMRFWMGDLSGATINMEFYSKIVYPSPLARVQIRVNVSGANKKLQIRWSHSSADAATVKVIKE